ncbi:restriction endonuclease [Streptomyces sp. NPDC006704]|uniref:restriction endonuclease n=1 Tax=Streptomyces sp. NPDC006704 TaxID=3364760 RepID=UPI003699A8D0
MDTKIGGMAKRSALRGYLLEEALAWLLRHSGYRLLVDHQQDRDELTGSGGALRVRGRGAVHQVDVLGEFAFTPAFSLPVRLFLEAKHYQDPCRLEVVRNAHGVLHDVNENFMNHEGTRPRRRYQYTYALFSANGFTKEAQQYALAHQISLVDLSGESFTWLRKAIKSTAANLYQAQENYAMGRFPVAWMRKELREALGTCPPGIQMSGETSAAQFKASASTILTQFVDALEQHAAAELLLGFPSAPFILPLAAEDQGHFLSYVEQSPDHAVRLRRSGQAATAEWALSPREDGDAYRLAFKLPEHIEEWISGIAEKERQRTLDIKQQFLSSITIYRMNGSGVRAYQLRYEPSELRQA